jgi:hypothetical protein
MSAKIGSALGGATSVMGVAAHSVTVASVRAAPPAATPTACERKRRRDGTMVWFEVASGIATNPCLLGVRAEAEGPTSPRLAFMVTIIMRKSIRVTTKKPRGRPPTTGKGVQIGERWHSAELAEIDAWIAHSGEEMTRAQAVRRLVEIGLGKSVSAATATSTAAASAKRAKELAGTTIDRLVDPAAPPEEKAVRKRRLIKGPSEFREARIDRPKKRK